GDTVVQTAGARLDGRERADAIRAARTEAGAPRRSEKRIVAVDEPRDVLSLGIVVLHEEGVVRNELLLPRNARGICARILEVAMENKDIGIERRSDLRLRDQIRIRRDRTQNAGECAVTENRLAAAAVRGA